ncbi:M23 family metallopeptidase [Candidatus Azambacteria bacterium]|nr:M23 family metallopeptidase [Candidatus Azambacteria bacterium]
MNLKQRLLVLLILLALVGGGFLFWQTKRKSGGTPPSTVETMKPAELARGEEKFAEPLPGAKLRMTKKPFGLYVTPQKSPVSPERFAGFHTGVDLEVTKAEEERDVPVYAFCKGNVIDAREVSGYGGVLVTDCSVNGEPVTVLYGHLKFSSIKEHEKLETLPSSRKIPVVEPGQVIGVLGRGFSAETDGERKHLHFAIHRGEGFSLRGYVDREEQLAEWMDPVTFLP